MPPVDPRLSALIDEILRFTWSENPTAATAMGIHDHDDRLVDCSPEALDGRLRAIVAFRGDLTRLVESIPAMTPDESLDVRVILGALDVESRQLKEARPAFRDPASYLDEILYGVYYLAEREFAPLPDRARTAARRLRNVPRLLGQARANLSDPTIVPREWVDAALRQTRGSVSFLEHLAGGLAPRAGASGPELAKACEAAAQALGEFGNHLKETLLDEASGDFACGRDLFELMLRAQHGVDLDADALDALGQRLIAVSRARLEEAARALDPRRPWQEMVAEWKTDHPAEERFVEEYRTEVERARDFVRARGLVTLPEGETLRVVETPAFQRTVTPYAAYVPPAPFEQGREGFLWVTPPEEGASPEIRERLLQDHMRPAIPATVAHEAYPGHHLQLSVAGRIASKARRYFVTPLLIEGWAFYSEELMAEQSYYHDPRSRVIQLKDQLWRACRVVIDVGLHTRGMSVADAAGMLTEIARLEAPNARAEVLRYTRSPTQPMSYAVGKEAILELREEIRRRRGDAFDLKHFHDDFLSYGSIPVSFIRERMLAPGHGAAPAGRVARGRRG
jgi:uncharacterized protein (DUF885 family)